MDQGLAKYDKNGNKYWAYGGHFEPEGVYHDYNFCMNGMVNPDRTPHPGLYEVRKVYQDIGFKAIDIKNGKIGIRNNRFFKNLSDCAFKWDLLKNGEVVKTGYIGHVDVKPQAEKEFALNFGKINSENEYFLNIYAINNDETEMFPFGHILAREQFKLTDNNLGRINSPYLGSIISNETDNEIQLAGESFTIKFDKNTGALSSYMYNNYELIKKPLVPEFWRAPTDNDFGTKMPSRNKIWKEAYGKSTLLSLKSTKVQASKIEIKAIHLLPTINGKIEMTYIIYSEGQIDINYEFSADKKDLPEIPRIGMSFQLPKEFDNLKYYGRGPWENYVDRNTASFVGLYKSTVADQYFAYSRPQENGHKSDVRWLSLTNHSGLGLKIRANSETIGFNALHYATSDFDPGDEKQLRTPSDIKEGDFVELHIDHKMMGVAGDNSWGAKPHEQYIYYANKKYNYSFSLIPLN